MRASFEAAFAHPLGRDPLLAGVHRRAAVQGARRRMRPVVAEEDGVAAHRRDLEAGVGEDGRAAGFGRVQVADDRGDALAAALEDRRRARPRPDRSSRSAAGTRCPARSAAPAGPRRSRAASRASAAMRASRRAQTGNSAGSKNMPSLVRAGVDGARARVASRPSRSAPGASARGRSARRIRRPRAGRRRRRRAAASSPSRRGRRGRRRAPRGVPACDAGAGHRPRRLGARDASPPAASRPRWSRRVVSSASSASASSQPLAFMASRTMSGGWPAVAWATIQRLSSGVIGCAAMAVILPDGAGAGGSRHGVASRPASGSRGCGSTSPCSSGVWSIILRGEQVHHRLRRPRPGAATGRRR